MYTGGNIERCGLRFVATAQEGRKCSAADSHIAASLRSTTSRRPTPKESEKTLSTRMTTPGKTKKTLSCRKTTPGSIDKARTFFGTNIHASSRDPILVSGAIGRPTWSGRLQMGVACASDSSAKILVKKRSSLLPSSIIPQF